MSEAGTVALNVLAEWRARAIPAKPLTGHEHLPILTSDVDVVIPERHLTDAAVAAIETAGRSGFSLAQVIWYDLRRCTAFVFWRNGEGFQLDLECDDRGLGRLGLSRVGVLKAEPGKEEQRARAKYLVRKRVYKGLLEPRHHQSLEAALDTLTLSAHHSDRELAAVVRLVIDAADGTPTEALRALHRKARTRRLLRNPTVLLRVAVWNIRRLAWRWRHPTGAVVDVIANTRSDYEATALEFAERFSLVFHRSIVMGAQSRATLSTGLRIALARRAKTLVLRWVVPGSDKRSAKRADSTIIAEGSALALDQVTRDLLPTHAAKAWVRLQQLQS